MPRIYFDTNVFSNLKSAKDERFKDLVLLLQKYGQRLSFYFSYAHIRDKHKDVTDHKFADFEYMKTIVGDNYLAYHPIDKKTSFYLATPRMVFDDNPLNDMNSLPSLFEPAEEEDDLTKSHKAIIKGLFSAIPMPQSSMSYESLPEDQQKLMAQMFPVDKENPTFFDLVKNMADFTSKIFIDSNLYKNLRKMIDEGINNGKLKLNDELDFNEMLKDTTIQKTFIDFIKDNIHFKDKDNIPFYDFYQCAYSMLDALGIDKDKITPKNTFTNLHIDGMHSYFAQYCDYFVTDDNTTTRKSTALYQLFNIETAVVSVEEFKLILPELLNDYDSDENLDWVLTKIIYDLQNSDRNESFVIEDKSIASLKRNHRYLDFFDTVLEVTGPSSYEVVIIKSPSNDLSEPSFSEQAIIIDKALFAFGEDIDGAGRFNYQAYKTIHPEPTERHWKIGNKTIELKNYSILGKYALVITLPEIEN